MTGLQAQQAQHPHYALFMRLSSLPGLQPAWRLRGGCAIQKFAVSPYKHG